MVSKLESGFFSLPGDLCVSALTSAPVMGERVNESKWLVIYTSRSNTQPNNRTNKIKTIISFYQLQKGNTMASSNEFTYQDVAGHNSAKSLYVVIHDGVYECTNFASEHP